MFVEKYMTKDEVISDYAQAANKKKQIKILAQLNLCSEDDIKEVLSEAAVNPVEVSEQTESVTESVDEVTTLPNKSRRGRKPKSTTDATEKLNKVDAVVQSNTTYKVIQELETLLDRRAALVDELSNIESTLTKIYNILHPDN